MEVSSNFYMGGQKDMEDPVKYKILIFLMSIFNYSLLGGVQLFAMIKMLGLLKQDMSSNQNMWAWHGYQVSMRVLELTLCTLLAVIATTPLRSDHNNSPGLEASPGKAIKKL